jgi:hypothetical protein
MLAECRAIRGMFSASGTDGNGAELDAFLPPDRTVLCAYGRQALAVGLERLGVGAGDLVLVPGFICRELLGAVRVVGADVRFYDVDEGLRVVMESLDRAGNADRVRAVVAVNYFGFPQPLDDVAAWCRLRRVALIEDNAHGFLSADGEIPLGRRGDLGIFSLRKTISLPNGAALVDNRADAPVRVGQLEFEGSCRRSEARWYGKRAAKKAIALGGESAVRSLVGAVRLLRRLATGSPLPASTAESEFTILRERLSARTADRLRRVAVQREGDRRRSLFVQHQSRFAGIRDVRPLFSALPPGIVPQGFPFLYVGDRPDRFVQEWSHRGVSIVRWPELPSMIAAGAPSHYCSVMLVPFLW